MSRNMRLRASKSVNFLLAVLAGTVFAVLLHQLSHDPLMTIETKRKSVVAASSYFPLVAFGSLALAFCIVGLTFLAIQQRLPIRKQIRGTLFGTALGGMYFVGMIEAFVTYPVPLIGELYTGAVDAGAILLMALLLGKYFADDLPRRQRLVPGILPSVMIIATAYVVTRYFSYAVVRIESSYVTRPIATFLWAVGMGCWTGVMYAALGGNIWPGSPFKKAAVFGGFVFGLNWLIFNLFVLLFIRVPVLDLLYRSVLDALAVTMGAYLSSLFSRRLASTRGVES